VRPEHALPLDPDLFSGRIDHATLIDMGYADGWQYLSQRGLDQPGGPAPAPPAIDNPTRMVDPVPGVRLQFEFAGDLTMASGGARLPVRLKLCVHVHDLDRFIAAPAPLAPLTGRLQGAPLAAGSTEPQPVWGGSYRQSTLPDRSREIEYRMQLRHGDRWLALLATQTLRDDPGFDRWQDLSTLSVKLSDGDSAWASGELRLALPDLTHWLGTVQATETRSLAEATRTVGRYARFFLRELSDVYGWTG
jgi:hypothetical protein